MPPRIGEGFAKNSTIFRHFFPNSIKISFGGIFFVFKIDGRTELPRFLVLTVSSFGDQTKEK